VNATLNSEKESIDISNHLIGKTWYSLHLNILHITARTKCLLCPKKRKKENTPSTTATNKEQNWREKALVEYHLAHEYGLLGASLQCCHILFPQTVFYIRHIFHIWHLSHNGWSRVSINGPFSFRVYECHPERPHLVTQCKITCRLIYISTPKL
jgi:hypothetical protein